MCKWLTKAANLLTSQLPAFIFVTTALVEGNVQAGTWSTIDSNIPRNCDAAVPDYVFEPHAGYTPGNAFLALLDAAVAENWTDASIRKELDAWGFTNTKLIGNIPFGSYGYIAEYQDFRILAFRGTHSLREGLIDATAATRSYADIGFLGRGHTGIRLNYRSIWPLVKKELTERQHINSKPLLVVGHSLGGSLAVLHAAQLKKSGFPILGVYTAAEPRVGDAALMNEVDSLIGDRLYRLENALDPVPHLPPTQANSEAFTQVFTRPQSPSHSAIQATIENWGYAPLPGWTLEITNRGFKAKRGIPAENASELAFLQALEFGVEKSNTVPEIAVQISKHVYSHIGNSYICDFLSLINQGYEPLVP